MKILKEHQQAERERILNAKREYVKNTLENYRPKVSEELRKQLKDELEHPTSPWSKQLGHAHPACLDPRIGDTVVPLKFTLEESPDHQNGTNLPPITIDTNLKHDRDYIARVFREAKATPI